MTTIAQLPPASSAGPGDLLPLSQDGVLYAVQVAQLTANAQPLLNIPTGALVGRSSTGAGAPEAVGVGAGLLLAAGTLSADGADHAAFPVVATISPGDDLVINHDAAPGLLPVTALRGLFTAGANVSIDANGVVAVTASDVPGPAGAAGPQGPAGPQGLAGPAGAAGPGLQAPAAGNSASSIGTADYVAIWQNGAYAWMPYGVFIGGQTINQLPAAAAAADSDELLVAQSSNALSVQSFGALWTYTQGKLPSFKPGIVELTGNTVLDGTVHNNRILVASAALVLTANFANMGPGFNCTLINLGAGSVTMGTGITSGTGGTSLPPGASASLVGLTYSGGSLVWWTGILPNAPTLTVGTISAPAPDTAFMISGGVFNDAPTAFDYSTDGGATWIAASSPVITQNAYSFNAAGLSPGAYAIRVRDHGNVAVVGISNSFAIAAPLVTINALPATVMVNAAVAVSGTVAPGDAAVQVGLSASATVAPVSWVNAGVAAGSWAASLTPAATGTVFIWARESASVQAVSGAINVVAATLAVSAPATGAVGTALAVTGMVSPAGDAVTVQLSTQNTVAPTSGGTAALPAGGGFSASLTPASAGNFYVWAEDSATGLVAVSGVIAVAAGAAVAFSINNPGGSYTHGSGTVALNGNVAPAQSTPPQVALSTSNNVAPAGGWETAVMIDFDTVWAIYFPIPATAGNYYVWVETATGGSQTVSSFTLNVT